MPVPEGYKSINAHEDSIEAAKDVKQDLGMTWNAFLEEAAMELEERLNDFNR